MTLVFKYINNTDKVIKGFKYEVTFIDMFGSAIVGSALENTAPIDAGGYVIDSDKSLEVNPFINSNLKLRDTCSSRSKNFLQSDNDPL